MHFHILFLEMVTIKKIAIVFILMQIVVNMHAQSDSLTLMVYSDQEFIVGECSRIELQNGEFSKYFFEEYRKYKPDPEVLENTKNKIFNCTITIVLGTRCHDSHQQVPRFFKILDAIDYNTNYLKIICLDKKKQTADYDISDLNIERVPTFICYRKDMEVGRIIETPSSTLEIDIYNIIQE